MARAQVEKRILRCGHERPTLWPVAKAPKKAVRAVKDEVVRMRVSAEQKAALVKAAEAEGLELSQWLRQLALRAAGVLRGQP